MHEAHGRVEKEVGEGGNRSEGYRVGNDKGNKKGNGAGKRGGEEEETGREKMWKQSTRVREKNGGGKKEG